MSRIRSDIPVYAFTRHEGTRRRVTLYRGVYAVPFDIVHTNMEALYSSIFDRLLELGLVRMRGRRRSPGRPVTFGTTDAFLEHYGLASLADLPGAAEMKAAGLLSLDLPAGFDFEPQALAAEEEDPLEEGAAFHVDFLDEGEGPDR